MNTIIRLSEVLEKKFNYYVPTIKELSYESVYFYKDEFDERIVPKEVVDHLESTIQTETASQMNLVQSTWSFQVKIDGF